MKGNPQNQLYYYADLIANARVMREYEYARLSTLNFDTLSTSTLKSISRISVDHPITEPSLVVKIATLVYILIKLRQDHFPCLIAILNNLNYDKNEQVGIFVSFVYSKVLKHVQRGFIQQKLDVCLLQLKSASNVLPTAYFLFFLAKYSPTSILLCITQFINATTKVILHPRGDVRKIGYDTLKLYLQILERMQTLHSQNPSFPLFIFAQTNLQKNHHEQHGAFLIFAALLECSPHLIAPKALELMDFFINLLPKCPHDLRSLLLHNLVLLAPLELETFKSQYFDIVLSSLWSDTNQPKVDELVTSSLLKLIQIYPELFKDSDKHLIVTLKNLLLDCEKAPMARAFSIVTELSTNFPLIIQSNSTTLTHILLKTKICEGYVQVVPPLFHKFPSIWAQYKNEFVEVICKTPNYIENVDVLEFLSQCPSFSSYEVTSRLIQALSVQKDDIRCFVPRAILNQISYDNDSFVMETIFRLITIALSDSDPRVREMVLKSFNSKCYKFLTTDPMLPCISTLIKDEAVPVSIAAIELLGKISQLNPFQTLPSLRKLLLDALFMLDSPRPLRIKEEMTRTFFSVVEATGEILPVYCPTLCLIALRQLSFTPSSELTYFDQSYINKINHNITKAIGIIAERDVQLIGPHISQFANFFIWFLQQHGPKQLKIAVVNTLYLIISGSNTLPQEIDMASMFNVLINVASKWNSKKLNIAVLKLIGAIGAMDQYVFDRPDRNSKIDTAIKPSNPSYSMAQACRTLLSIVSDDFLVVHHADAIRSLVTIFCTDSTTTVSFFNEFMTLFLAHIRKQKSYEYVVLLGKVCSEAPTDWIMHYTNELLDLIRELWKTSLLSVTLDLIPILARVVADRFSSFLPECATFLLDTLFTNRTSHPDLCYKVLVAIVSLKDISGDYLFLIFPEIVEVLTTPTTLPEVRANSLVALRVLVQNVDCSLFSAPIIRCVTKIIQIDEVKLQDQALMILYSLVVRLGDQFSFYAEQTVNILQRKNLFRPQFFEILHSKSMSFEDFPFIETNDPFTVIVNNRKLTDVTDTNNDNGQASPYHQNMVDYKVDEKEIHNAFNFQEDEAPWNWKEWYRTLVRTLLLNSPSPSLFSCSFLGEFLFNLAETLFNSSFLSVWLTLSNEMQLFISASLTRALLSERIPEDIRTSLINLFDFMERSEHPIQISRQILCQTSEKCSQYAKAFYFVDRWIEEEPENIEAIETLTRLSSYLGLKKTIVGISSLLQKHDTQGFHEWYERLGLWSEALESYQKMDQTPKTFEKMIRCLKHLQRWDEIIEKMPQFIELKSTDKKKVALAFATALFHRQQWPMLANVLEYCTKDSVRSNIITALYQISQDHRDEALQTVSNGFTILAQNARGVFKHDKAALYPLMVKAQQLHEISEIAQHKENLEVWERRLKVCRQSFDVYHQIISVHLTVFPVDFMMKESLKMVKLALRSKDFQLFNSSLHFLFPQREFWPVEVAFLHAKGLWASRQQTEALSEAKNILKVYKEIEKNIKAQIYYICGQWIISMTPPNLYNSVIKNAVKFLEQSIRQGTHYFKAWHRWAWACSIIYNNDKLDIKSAFNAIIGFLECVRLRNQSTLSELIQMISLFFSADLNDEDFQKTTVQIYQLSDSCLLKIIPQLFTRLQETKQTATINIERVNRSRTFVASIASKLLPVHYHVLMYPLMIRGQQKDVSMILSHFSGENSMAAHQSRIISDGLIECSSSLLETYSDTIISIVRMIQNEKYNSAFDKLQRVLSIQLKKSDGQATLEINEELFAVLKMIQSASEYSHQKGSHHSFDRNSIHSMTKSQFVQFTQVTIVRNLMNVFQKIRTILHTIHTLSMHSIAPTLAQLRNSIMAVPGTYKISEPVTTIFQFDPSLELFNSKQRPRLVKVYGSDGIQHQMLLKGREDLRMDQRVMQFFELINQHITNDLRKEYQQTIQITTYSITPLSTQAGLIIFVDGTDTLFHLISEYRAEHKVPVFSESDQMEEMTIKNVDSLTTLQRLEALDFIADTTSDNDLHELMWLNSPSSRVWIARTMRFTESCALMSIIGYVLGLGDRHPSNLMIQRLTGSVVHIDFGDCFEAGRKRIKFPEKVPFRLTRLMKRAFGPTGIHGTFQVTCEETVKLVRSHKDSIMAVLDIFLQEPIESDEQDTTNEDEITDTEINSIAHSNSINVFGSNDDIKLSEQNNNGQAIDYENTDIVDKDADAARTLAEEDDMKLKKCTTIEEALKRIMQKITGHDFNNEVEMTVTEQVNALIEEATSMYNLAHLYHGWTPLW